MVRPSVSVDGKLLAVTAIPPYLPEDITENEWPLSHQIAAVDTAGGEITWLTNEPLGALCPVFAPKGGRIAYLTIEFANDKSTVRILDLDSKRVTIVWRDDEERLLSDAEQLAHMEGAAKGIAAFRKLLAEFPNTRFRNEVWYRVAMLSLEPCVVDLDQAFSALRNVETRELREQAQAVIWREEDRLATDPPADWLQTYGTDTSQEEFKFNTDLTRDLTSLSAKWGDDRLYLRVGYGSGRDLHGLTFQDTILLFDHDSPETGHRQITPSTQWDRGAERKVIIRHWFDQCHKSQYHVEIVDQKGETVSRFSASGFPDAFYPYLDVLDLLEERRIQRSLPEERSITISEGAVVLSLSRDALGLKDGVKTYLQICTVKGGIEEHKKLERPRIAAVAEQPVCDVADAFGAENTRERIETDHEAGAPPIIRGIAATLEPPQSAGSEGSV